MGAFPYKVSVECHTYNQAPYVTQALEGFVRQETGFPFVVVVVDDASTDGTQERILAFLREQFAEAPAEETEEATFYFTAHRQNPNCHFAVYLLKTNHLQAGREQWAYLDPWRSRAQYLAFCEGDDYWIRPDKLRRQAQVLDRHPKVGLVYGPARSLMQETGQSGKKLGRRCRGFSHLLRGNLLYTPTVMLRLSLLEGYRPLKRPEWLMGDYPMWLYVAGKARLYWMRQTFAVYRILPESASHSSDAEKRRRFLASTFEIQWFFARYYHESNLRRLRRAQEHLRKLL